ncbi:hypothetical protein [Rhizobium sp. SSA_523]|uniref:hypothetical protein n=1 Tax=Rhizobium sp. SSA_523 TaxID=2952477 RepID=UPI002090065F|nr:hypothetical protein [Rhizobium sp. SSA_523]MCO5730059.1 hypothetical protein [Rhizobium sp. SSA_523]WKC25125.1 hypothetical protein QTJ18_14145 [Rhizobium sp. SSA_523]
MSKPITHVPIPTFGPSMAIRVHRGHSMGAIQDGWMLYYNDDKSKPTADLNGKLCLVKLPNGRILTRIVKQAWDPNKWDLSTINGQQMINQTVEWAEPVLFIQPHVLTDEEKALLVEAEER